MRCLLVTVGSRGDAEPFIALADELIAANHSVDLFLQTEHEYTATTKSSDLLTIHRLPFSQFDFYQFLTNPTNGKDHPDERVRFTGIVTDVIAGLVFPCMAQVLQVAASVDVVVCSSLARPLCVSICRHLGCCLGIVHLQPLAPTKAFPHYSRDNCVEKIMEGCQKEDSNEETYWMLERVQADFLKDRLEQTCLHVLGSKDAIPDSEELQQILSGRASKTFIFNCFSNELCPTTPHDHVYTVGSLADEFSPGEFEPPQELVDFLTVHKDNKPIAIGFGSMPFNSGNEIVQALELLNRPSVLVGDALGKYDETDWSSTNIVKVSASPYPWLLPQCHCMVSHGGAGVVHSTMRAGIPQIIVPLMGDQFFWAKLLEAKGLGVNAGKMPNLTSEILVACLKKVDNVMISKAKETRDCLKDKHGTKEMVGILESVVLDGVAAEKL